MSKRLKKYFIPHRENDYQPHFLRRPALTVVGLAVVLIFFLVLVQGVLVGRTGLLADVISGVLVDLANTDRSANKIGTLKVNPLLVEAAQEKANDMAQKGYFAHQSPSGLTPWYWFTKVNYPFVYAGENLAINFSDSLDVEQAWMNSPGHRANILSGNFSEIGIATARGRYQGQDTIFVVQMFGLPALADATPLAAAPVLREVPPAPVAIIPRSPARLVRGEATDNLFLAVKNEAATPAPVAAPTQPVPVQHPSPVEQLISSPSQTRTYATYAYLAIGALIILAILLAVLIEIRKQYPRLIIESSLLLLLIGFLWYAQQGLLASQLLIK